MAQPMPPDSNAFPVTWEDPAHAEMFWQWDEFRFPTPLTPFTWSVWERIRSRWPSSGPRRTILMNGYQYSAKWPPVPAPDATAAEDADAMEKARRQVAAQPALWRDALLPELEADIRMWRSLNLPSLEDGELRRLAEDAIARHLRHWEIHGQGVGPVYLANALLDGLLDRILGPGRYDPATSYRLLQGEDNMSWSMAAALSGVAEAARPHPEAVRILTTPDLDTAVLLERLQKVGGGAPFLEALHGFLDQYGYRSAAGEDFYDVLWREDPSFVLAAVRGYLVRPPLDGTARRSQLRQERAELEQEILSRTDGEEAPAQELRETLALARAAWPVRESHSYYIEQQSTSLVRTIFREAGRRLTSAGRLDGGDDVFFLTCEEVLTALDSAFEGDPAAVARARRAEYDCQCRLTPPATLGTPPPPDAPSAGGWRGLRERQGRNFQGSPVSAGVGHPFSLQGIAASRGVVHGPVRVVRGLHEFRKVRSGDVLVCPTTTPPWSVLFGTVTALITESGGSLSHGAIMAREFHIPAVMSAMGATRVLRDGQMVVVNGDTGEVSWGPAAHD